MKKVFLNTFFIAFVATLLILFASLVIDKSNPLGSMSGFLGFLVADVLMSFVVGLAVAFLACTLVLTGKCILFFLAFIGLLVSLALPDNEDASSTKTKLDKGVVLFGLAILAILACAFFTSDGTSKAAVVVAGIACSAAWVSIACRTRICERKHG